MAYDGPIMDNHFHLNRQGRFLEAARDFRRTGGTHVVLVHCPDFSSPPTTLEGHREAYADTVAMAASLRSEVGLSTRVVLGPHPAAFAHQFERWVNEDGDQGKERAVENYRASIEAAVPFLEEGEAHAIGEVGRPHWPVSDEVWALSNELLEETMHMAAQGGFPLQLHVEGESDETYGDLAMRARRQGMALDMLIRHYSPPNIDGAYTHGLTPSVLAGKGSVDAIMASVERRTHGFFLETDYMDDLRRPGAVLGPKPVPNRPRQLLEAGLDESIMWDTHHDLPLRLYGEATPAP